MERPMRVPLIAFLALVPLTALAQGAAPVKPEMNESCPGLVAQHRPPFVPAALRLAALTEGEVRISYAGPSTFLIESPKLVRIATDYNDYVRTPVLPDIVTMNRAHSTHYTDRPEAGIRHGLRGWKDDGKPTDHDLSLQGARVRSVATNIRDWGGGTQRHGNSIFIFELANLCIAHLGHLHHTLTQQQLNEIGRVDVVLVPVDGGATLDLEGMIEVLTALKAPLMIPMHFFSSYTLDRFLQRISKDWDVERAEVPSVVVSKHSLPTKPKLLVLPGRAFCMPADIRHRTIAANGSEMHVAEAGEGPLVLMCHGWPELWYSWRHQLVALAEAGFHAVAPDMRGFGRTSAPQDVAAYTILHTVGDMVALVAALGEPRARLVGHDWGAPVAWHCALMRPDLFPAVAAMSVPRRRRGLLAPLETLRKAGESDYRS